MNRLAFLMLFLLAALLAGCSGSVSGPGILDATDAVRETSGYSTVTILNSQYTYLNFTATCTVTDYSSTTIWVRYQICNTSGDPLAGKSWDSFNWNTNWSQYIDGSGLASGYYILKATAWGDDSDKAGISYEPLGFHWIWIRKA